MNKKRLISTIILIVLVWFACLFPTLLQQALDRRSGPEHTFVLEALPPFLTEETALHFARMTLDLDGLRAANWQPQPEDRSQAPDGRKDQYVCRNTIDPDSATIIFERLASKETRIVRVKLIGKRVVCQVGLQL